MVFHADWVKDKDGRTVTRRSALVLLTAAALAGPGLSWAGSLPAPEIGAKEGHARAVRGELLLIDVRSPDEWRATGLPQGSEAVTIHDPDGLAAFVAKVRALAGEDKSRPVAFICATGIRASRAQQLLTAEGYNQVYNLREGMMGSSAGPGWVRRGLPRVAPAIQVSQ